MKIYTKTGDSGETSLFGGARAGKGSLRVCAIGSVDELNAYLGECRAIIASARKKFEDDKNAPDIDVYSVIFDIQKFLFIVGADIATPADAEIEVKRVCDDDVELLEKLIDRIDEKLEPLSEFIVPGSSAVEAALHTARGATRRAERETVKLTDTENVNSSVLKYLNRLSDLLFVLSRYVELD